MDWKKQGHVGLPLGDFRQCPSARKLFDFLSQAFPVKVNKQRTLNSFVIWLIERLIDKDVSDPSRDENELKEWYQLLKSCRIDDQTILGGYIRSKQTHLSKHPLDARRLHMMETELRALMNIPASSSQAFSQTSKADGSSAIALVKDTDNYAQQDRSRSVQKSNSKWSTTSKLMDDYIHPDRRVSVQKVVVSPATIPSKLMDDYIYPDRRVSVPTASNDYTSATEADMGDYIHPGRRALVSTAQDSSTHASSTPDFAHMHPDRVPPVSVGHSSSPALKIMYGQMHPDRMKVSRDAAPEPGGLVEEDTRLLESSRTGTGRQGKGNRYDPSCPDLSYQSGANAMALQALEREKEKESLEGEKKEKEGEPDFSFPTGSNRDQVVFNEDWALARKRRKAMQFQPTLDYDDNSVGIGKAKSTGKGSKDFVVTGNYVCNRCKVRGHLIQDCPTNGDSRFAVKAPEDYTCVKCGKQADHYVGDCPQRPSFSRGLRNIQVEQSSPRRAVSDSFGDSFRPVSRSQKRHHNVDSDVEEVDSSAWTSGPRRKRGRGSPRDDNDSERTLSIRGHANRNDFHWSRSADNVVVITNYVDPDRPARSENPARVYTNRKHLPVIPDSREEGRLSYYDVPSEEVQSTKIHSRGVKIPKKAQRMVPKLETLPVRVTSAPPRTKADIWEVSQMIEEEKIKDDLIPSFFQLFLDKKVHRRAKEKRPVATDLIQMPSDSEERDDDVMEVDQGSGFVKREQGGMSAAQETNTSVIQHLHGVIDVDDDTIMTEARPCVIVSGLGDFTDLTELSDGDSKSDIVVVDD